MLTPFGPSVRPSSRRGLMAEGSTKSSGSKTVESLSRSLNMFVTEFMNRRT